MTAYSELQTIDSALPAGGIFETRKIGDTLYVVIGPDGHQRGSIPTTVHETDDIDVLVYSAKGSTVTIEVSNCDLPGVSVLGSAASLKLHGKNNASADLKTYGHCSGSKVVSIKATPDDGKKCAATTTTLQTLTVYRLTVGLAGALYVGDEQKVGVDVGVGGTPNKAFQRNEARGMQTKVVVGWFPGGFSDDRSLSDWRHRAFVGTALDSSSALSSANVLGGYEVVTGLAVFAGLQFAEQESALGGGLKDGAIFTDDSSKLPTRQEWEWVAAPFVGVAITADLLAKIAK